MDLNLIITVGSILITFGINFGVIFGVLKTKLDNIDKNQCDGFKRINGELHENREWRESHIKDWHKK